MPTHENTVEDEAKAEVSRRAPRAAIVIIGLLMVVAVIFVVSSFRRTTPLTFYPASAVDPHEVGTGS